MWCGESQNPLRHTKAPVSKFSVVFFESVLFSFGGKRLASDDCLNVDNVGDSGRARVFVAESYQVGTGTGCIFGIDGYPFLVLRFQFPPVVLGLSARD